MSILLYGCTTRMLNKFMEKKLDINYTRMLRAILNKSSRQYPTKQQLYGHLPPITKTIKVRRTRHVGHYERCKDELINDIHLWTTSFARSDVGWPARSYIQQLCAYTGCSLEDLPGAMEDREGGKIGTGRSVIAAWNDDDDDEDDDDLQIFSLWNVSL